MNLFEFPGLIDCHVHFREPGLTHKGDMETESAAARAGGVMTVCDMPNTVPATTSIAALQWKMMRCEELQREGRASDIRFFFGVTEPKHLIALHKIWIGGSAEFQRLKRRCCGVKLYLDHSTGQQKIAWELLEEVFHCCAELKIPLVAHCEDPQINAEAARNVMACDAASHSLRRPPESEVSAINTALHLVREHGTSFHIAHLSTAQGLGLVRSAKREQLPVTCEVAPHHLFLTTVDYATLGTFAKVNPPLRSPNDQCALWEGITDGTVDCIASDHAPHTLEEKRLDPLEAPSGVPGVETLLPLLFTVAAGEWPHPHSSFELRASSFQHEDIVRLCFENPNRIFNLGKEKSPQEKITINTSVEWVIRADTLHGKCKWTPYEGWNVVGKVVGVTPQR